MVILKRIWYTFFCSFMGICLIVVGLWNYLSNINETNNNTVSIEATISNIKKEIHYNSQHNREYYYRIFVDYSYNDIYYENKEINLSSNLYKIGDKIKIKLNPDNPSNPIYIEQKLLSIIIIIVGIVLFGIGIKISMLFW